MNQHTCIELCAGAGGQALGLEQAGFHHVSLVEIDPSCCQTLITNRPQWNILQADIYDFQKNAHSLGQASLLAAGLPCPPFSVAGKQLGKDDERDLFPPALDIIGQLKPRAVLIENVRGFLDPRFDEYRQQIVDRFTSMGYTTDWMLLNARDFGVSQSRPRVVIVALPREDWFLFSWPSIHTEDPLPVGDVLFDLMAAEGWKGANSWRKQARGIAPAIVGGSKKHGGPDLGPTRARTAWKYLGIDGLGLTESPPHPDFIGYPRLTIRMVARLQGFPDEWVFTGRKTQAYRQVGNAFPPPMAKAVATQILKCLQQSERIQVAV